MKEARSALTRLDLNLLVALYVLITEQSVTKAAERLSMGQQAMSASLAKLRRLLDDPLLIRSGRGLVRTPVAERLMDPVIEALSLFAGALSDRTAFDPTHDAADFTVMASDYVTLVLLQDVLRKLAEETPRVRVSIRPVPADFENHMRSGQADLMILPRQMAASARGLLSRPVFQDRFVCIVDADHPDVEETLTAEQFHSLPYIAYDGGVMPSAVQIQMAEQGIERIVDVTTRSFVVAALMVEGTDFMTVVHERLARHVARRARVRVIKPPFAFEPITEAMYWTMRTHDNPAHQWLRAKIASAGREMDAEQYGSRERV